MPLRDHFHSPVKDTHSWDEVHGGWPMEIVRDLRNILPAGFRAGPNVHLGSSFEVDVTTSESVTAPESEEGGAGTMTALSPTLTIEADLSDQDVYEVRIYDSEHGRILVAAIEIVSPSSKDQPATREVFVGKVATLLQQGICVSIVDLVSVRQANLYAELLTQLGRSDPSLGETPPHLYAVTLRARKRPHLARAVAARHAAAGDELRGNLSHPRHRLTPTHPLSACSPPLNSAYSHVRANAQ